MSLEYKPSSGSGSSKDVDAETAQKIYLKYRIFIKKSFIIPFICSLIISKIIFILIGSITMHGEKTFLKKYLVIYYLLPIHLSNLLFGYPDDVSLMVCQSPDDYSRYTYLVGFKYIAPNKLSDEKRKQYYDIMGNKQLKNDMTMSVTNDIEKVYYLFYSFIFTLIIALKYRKRYIRYTKCPYEDCGKSINVYIRWNCPNCGNQQFNESYVSAACDHCRRSLEHIYCEWCHKKVLL